MIFFQEYKNQLIYWLTILFSILFLFVGYKVCKPDTENTPQGGQCFSAKVISIEDKTINSYTLGEDETSPTFENTTIRFSAIITNGALKHSVVEGIQNMDGIAAVNPKEVKIGDSILITSAEEHPSPTSLWDFVEYDRSFPLALLCGFFFLLLLLFGGKKGGNTILSLIFTCIAIFAVYIPSIEKGYSIYITSTIICVFIVFMNLLLLNGANIKTLCAILGNLGGLLVSGVLTLFMNNILNITGLVDNDAAFLLLQSTTASIDLKGIVWSGILIGSLGAIMDVAMSIASALQELSENIEIEHRRFSTFLRSGLNIGRDAMGTMTNTLILAYIGSSLAMALLLILNSNDMLWLFNLEMIVVEILQSLTGSIGILCAIPITSAASAYLYTLPSKKPMAYEEDTPDFFTKEE
ncbi:MAG: YibE/F family protein [Epulopiscium sp.]|jgi:uncharacterized membrane protein|nr:YibE/F family protein [Candidatus Epulonipiscium sp.]